MKPGGRRKSVRYRIRQAWSLLLIALLIANIPMSVYADEPQTQLSAQQPETAAEETHAAEQTDLSTDATADPATGASDDLTALTTSDSGTSSDPSASDSPDQNDNTITNGTDTGDSNTDSVNSTPDPSTPSTGSGTNSGTSAGSGSGSGAGTGGTKNPVPDQNPGAGSFDDAQEPPAETPEDDTLPEPIDDAQEPPVEASEEDEETTDPELVEGSYLPAQTFEGKAGYLRVEVQADEGVFPEQTTMHLSIIPRADAMDAAQKAIDEDPSRDETVVDALAVDITFYDADGNEIQPLIPGGVHVTLTALRAIEGEAQDVAHIDDNGNATLLENHEVDINATVKEDSAGNTKSTNVTADFDAEHFSVYAIIGSDGRQTDDRIRRIYTFKAPDASGVLQVYEVQTVRNGDTLREPALPTPPHTDTYFTGWYDENGEKFIFDTDGTHTVSDINTAPDVEEDEEVTLTAQFSTEYAVIFWNATQTDIIDVKPGNVGESVSLTGPAPILDPNQVHVGWIDIDSPSNIYGTDDTVTIPSGQTIGGITYGYNVNLKAYIRDVYKIQFDDNAGLAVDGDGTEASFTEPILVYPGEKAAAPADPARTGYTFGGWYEDQTCTLPFDFNEPVSANHILYAKWNPTEVNFDVYIYKEVMDSAGRASAGYVLVTKTTGTANAGTTIDWDADYRSAFESSVSKDEFNPNFYNFKEFKASRGGNAVIWGDGSTVINVYYDLKTLTLRFSVDEAGSDNGGIGNNVNFRNPTKASSLIKTYKSSSMGSGHSLTVNGTKYTGSTYTIEAKLGEYIGDRWPDGTNSFTYKINDSSSSMFDYNGNTYTFVFTRWYRCAANTSGSTPRRLSRPPFLIEDLVAADGSETLYEAHYTNSTGGTTWTVYYWLINSNVANSSSTAKTSSNYTEAEEYRQTIFFESGTAVTGTDIAGFSYDSYISTISGGRKWNLYYLRDNIRVEFHNHDHTENPTDIVYGTSLSGLQYTPDISTTTLNSDWEFEGWYLDRYYQQPVDWNAVPDGNLVLYAHYQKKKVTVSFDTGDGASSVPAQTIEIDSAAKRPENDPTREGYEFEGWYIGNMPVDFDNRKFTADTTITAVWRNNKEYAVHYLADTMNGADEAPANTGNRYRFNTHILIKSRAAIDPSPSQPFLGWRVKGTGQVVLPGEVLLFDDLAMVTGTTGTNNEVGVIELEAYYGQNPDELVRITYNKNDGSSDPEETYSEYFMRNTDMKAASADTFSRTGYQFVSWNTKADGSGQEITAGRDISAGVFDTGTTTRSDNVLYAIWREVPITYTVIHMGQNLDDNAYGTELGRATRTASAGADAYAVQQTFAGFTFDSGETEKDTALRKDTETPGRYYKTFTAADVTNGTNVIYLYYTRNAHTVTYKFDGAIPQGGWPTDPGKPSDQPNIKYGQTVTVSTADPGTPSGYTFSGWAPSSEISVTDHTFTMIDRDVTLTGYFTPVENGSTFTVEHWMEKLEYTSEENRYELPAGNAYSYPRTGTVEATATAVPHSFTGFEYDSGNTREVLSGTVLGNGGLTLKLYYNRVRNGVIYSYEGTTPVGGFPAVPTDNGTYAYETIITPLTPPSVPAGYTFDGWRTKTAIQNADGTVVMPEHTLELIGSFSPKDNVTYKTEHYWQNEAGDGYSLHETVSETGTTGETVYADVINYTGLDLVTTPDTVASGIVTVDDSGNGNLVLKLYYNRRTFTVTYHYDNEPSDVTLPALPETRTYRAGQTVTVDAGNIDVTGYTFGGWHGRAGSTLGITSGGTFEMPYDRDVDIYGTFTAKTNVTYTVSHYTQNLDGTWKTEEEYTNSDGTTGAWKDTVAHSYTGFVYDEANENNVTGGYIKADGTSHFKRYYRRVTNRVTYEFNGTEPTSGFPQTPTDTTQYPYEQTVTLPQVTAPAGYTFNGWQSPEIVKSADGKTFAMPASAVTVYGSFTANTDTVYHVRHYVECVDQSNPDAGAVPVNGTYYLLDAGNSNFDYTKTGSTDTQGSASDKTFAGLDFDETATTANADAKGLTHEKDADGYHLYGNIAGDGSLSLEFFYTRKSYQVTYTYTGYQPTNESPTSAQLTTDWNKTYKYGEIVSVMDDTAVSAHGYRFSGWSSFNVVIGSGSNRTFTMPASNVTIAGTFSPENGGANYTVRYYLEIADGGTTSDQGLDIVTAGGTTYYYELPVHDASVGHQHEYSYKGTANDTVTFSEEHYDGFVLNWDATKESAINRSAVADNTFTEENGVKKITGTISGADDLVIAFYYDRATYTVDYEYEGTVPAGASPANNAALQSSYEKIRKYGDTVNINENSSVTAPTGYHFSGWSAVTDSDLVIDADGNFAMPARHVDLVGHFSPDTDTEYTVEHYFQNVDGTYAIDSALTQTLEGTTDANVTGVPLTAEERENAGHSSYHLDTTVAGTKSEGKIEPDGSLTLKFYYALNTHTVTYHYETALPSDATPAATPLPVTVTYRVGQTVTVADDPASVPNGYTFSGWHGATTLPEGATSIGSISAGTTFAMPDRDVNIFGAFTAKQNTVYYVRHYLQNADGTGYTLQTTDTLSGTTNTTSPDAQPDSFTGFTWNRNAEGTVLNGRIVAEGMDGYPLTLRLYYDRVQNGVIYRFREGTTVPAGAPSLPTDSLSYRYGAKVTVSAKNMNIQGYEFNGWNTISATKNVDGTVSMPERTLILEGYYTLGSANYTIEYYGSKIGSSKSGINDYELIDSETVTTAKTGDSVSVSPKTIAGFTRKTNTKRPADVLSGVVQPDGSLVLKVYYDRESYPVEYSVEGTVPQDLDAATRALITTTTPRQYEYGQTVTFEADATAQGWRFSGWGTKELTVTNRTFTMPARKAYVIGSFTAITNGASFTVEHYREAVEEGVYERYLTEEMHGTAGQVAHAEAKEFTGFRNQTSVTDKEGNILSEVNDQILVGDGGTVLKLYYKRDRFDVVYHYEGSVPAGAAALPATQEHAYAEIVTTQTPEPSVAGYTFSGWHTSGQIPYDTATHSFTMPDRQAEVYGEFKVNTNTPYTVRHHLQIAGHAGTDPANDFEIPSGDEYKRYGTTGDDTRAVALDIEGYTYDASILGDGETHKIKIAGDESTVVDFYYVRNSVNVTYAVTAPSTMAQHDREELERVLNSTDPSAPGINNNALYAGSHAFGETLQVADVIDIAGYTVSAWRATNVTVTNGSYQVPATDVTFRATLTPKNDTPYRIIHMGEDLNDNDFNTVIKVEGGTIDAADGTLTGTTASVVSAYRLEGDDLPDGFSYNAAKTTEDVRTKAIRGDGETILYVYYSRDRFNLHYNYTGTVPAGATSLTDAAYQTTTHKYGETVDVAPKATAPGYTFSGWGKRGNATDLVIEDGGVNGTGQFVMPGRETFLVGSFQANTDTKYTVVYLFEKADHPARELKDEEAPELGYQLEEEDFAEDASVRANEEKEGITDTTARVTPPQIAGFAFDAGLSRTETNIDGDGNATLTLYYTRLSRNYSYQITAWPKNVTDGTVPAGGTARNGETLTLASVTDYPGYEFKGWDASISTASGDPGATVPMPNADVVFTGTYEPKDVEYQVETYTRKSASGTYAHQASLDEMRTGKHDDTVSISGADLTLAGYEYDGTAGNVTEGTLVYDGTQVVLKRYFTMKSQGASDTHGNGTIRFEVDIEPGAPVDSVTGKSDDLVTLAKEELTPKELEEIHDDTTGETALIWLEIEPVTEAQVGTEDAGLVKDAAGLTAGTSGLTTAAGNPAGVRYMDISLYEKITKSTDGDVLSETQLYYFGDKKSADASEGITEGSQPYDGKQVTITVQVPQDIISETLQSGYQREYAIYRVHNYHGDAIDGQAPGKKAEKLAGWTTSTTLKFDTGLFCTYALVWRDVPVPSGGGSGSSTGSGTGSTDDKKTTPDIILPDGTPYTGPYTLPDDPATPKPGDHVVLPDGTVLIITGIREDGAILTAYPQTATDSTAQQLGVRTSGGNAAQGGRDAKTGDIDWKKHYMVLLTAALLLILEVRAAIYDAIAYVEKEDERHRMIRERRRQEAAGK